MSETSHAPGSTTHNPRDREMWITLEVIAVALISVATLSDPWTEPKRF